MNRAFSLVELSIVLVILGLLTGGILAGQSLIRASELRAAVTERNKYVTAVQTFRDKYFALPGDMNNASKFWGALDGNDGLQNDCRAESTTALVCNGDGNGQICVDHVCAAATFEQFMAWKHMANAGLIEGSYTGAAAGATTTVCTGSATDMMKPGCNVPQSKLANGFWFIRWVGSSVGDTYLWDGQYGNTLSIGLTPAPMNSSLAFSMKPEEAWNLDTKLDDGKPGTGSVVSSRWNQCGQGAASTADVANGTYNLSDTRVICQPIFRNVF